MKQKTFKQQLLENAVAIIGLLVAVTALLYTGWREETTEKNRTLRTAGFEVLKHLGELQIVVNNAYYTKADPQLGWGHVTLISDLSELLPQPVPRNIEQLVQEWSENINKISTNEAAVTAVSETIDTSRKEVLETIRYLR